MDKSNSRRSDKVVGMTTAEPDAPPNRSAAMDDGDIARRAFQLYCERGGKHGHDVDDWLQAERELRGEDMVAVG